MAEEPTDGVNRQANADDIAELIGFLHQLEGVLQQVLDDGSLLPVDALDSLRDAWLETKDDLNSWRESMPDTTTKINAKSEALRVHGLTGKSLAMKLRGWRSRLFAIGERMDRPWLRSVLRWGETIIESFTDAIPGGAGVKEFVQAVSNYVDDADRTGSDHEPPPPPPRPEDRVMPVVAKPGDRVILDIQYPPSEPPT